MIDIFLELPIHRMPDVFADFIVGIVLEIAADIQDQAKPFLIHAIHNVIHLFGRLNKFIVVLHGDNNPIPGSKTGAFFASRYHQRRLFFPVLPRFQAWPGKDSQERR